MIAAIVLAMLVAMMLWEASRSARPRPWRLGRRREYMIRPTSRIRVAKRPGRRHSRIGKGGRR